MSQAVVHFLELIQVQHQQGLASVTWFGQARARLGKQGPPVRQPRELVGGGGQKALVRHPREKASGRLGTGHRRQQGHPRQGHSQCR